LRWGTALVADLRVRMRTDEHYPTVVPRSARVLTCAERHPVPPAKRERDGVQPSHRRMLRARLHRHRGVKVQPGRIVTVELPRHSLQQETVFGLVVDDGNVLLSKLR
jgi:hypothetical protein